MQKQFRINFVMQLKSTVVLKETNPAKGNNDQLFIKSTEMFGN